MKKIASIITVSALILASMIVRTNNGLEKENKETKQRYDERFEKIMRNWKGVNYDSLRLEQLKEEYGPNYVDHLDEL